MADKEFTDLFSEVYDNQNKKIMSSDGLVQSFYQEIDSGYVPIEDEDFTT